MTSRMGKSLGSRIVRASIAVGIAHLILKLVGLIQAILVGRYLDSGTYDVVYAFAFEGVIFNLFLIGEEIIGPAFLPVFMRELDERGEGAAWNFANVVLTLQTILLFIVILLTVCFPDSIIGLTTAWKADTTKYLLARSSIVWLAPALLCFSLGSTTYMILNGYKRFFLAAFGDASWKICVLLSLATGIGVFGLDYRALIFGLLVGSVAKLTTHLVAMARHIRFLRPRLCFGCHALKTFAILMLPLIVGILFAKLRDVYNNVTVLSHLNTDGLIKANSFGRKLYVAIGWLVPYALSIAIFPYFCELADKKDMKRLGEIITQSGRMLLAVFIPFSLVCCVLSRPIAIILFRGGEFSAEVAAWSGISMACYILVLPAFAIEYLLMQGCFANRKMVAVTIIGIVCSMVTIGVSYAGIIVFHCEGVHALMVIALGYTFGRTLKAATLIGMLKRSVPMFPGKETTVFVVRVMLTGGLVAASASLCMQWLTNFWTAGESKLTLLSQLTISSIVAAGTYLLATVVLRMEEPILMWRWAFAKVRRN